MIKRLFWLILICSTHVLTGQDSLDLFEEILNKKNPAESKLRVDSLIEATTASGAYELSGKMQYYHALYFAISKNYPVALELANQAVSFHETHGLQNIYYDRLLYNRGRFYTDNAEYEKTIEAHEHNIKFNSQERLVAKSHAEIGWAYFNLGDLYQAINYFREALPLLQQAEEYESLAKQTMNMAMVYRGLGTADGMNERLKLLQYADSVDRTVGMTSDDKVILKTAFANQYIDDRFYDFNLARSYNLESLKIAIRDSVDFGVFQSYNNLSNLYNLETRDSALHFAELGLQSNPNKKFKARLNDNISQYYLLRNDLPEALKYINKALEVNLDDSLTADELPREEALIKAEFKDHTLYCLKKKIEIYLLIYDQSADRQYLNRAIDCAIAADLLIGTMANAGLASNTRLYWRERAGELYQMGSRAAFLAGKAEDLFFFTEKNKALLLTEDIQQNTSYEMLPKNVFDQLNDLKAELRSVEVSKEKNNGRARFRAQKDYDEYLDSIKTVYASYFRKHPTNEPLSLTETQDILGKKTALISYIWNDTEGSQSLTGLLVDQNQTQLFEVEDAQGLLTQLAAYKAALSRPLTTNDEEAAFYELSHQLYRQLIPTDYLSSENLLIITDGPLQQIPFETLVTNPTEGSYLVESINLSYLYSISFLKQSRDIKRTAEGNLLAYAPNNFSGVSLQNLSHTPKEMAAIEAHFEGTFIQDAPASKEHFIDNSGQYKILHLATHAKGQEDAWIAFANKKLQLHELYSYRNNAELVTLSGCDTQTGVIAKGEGVLSLARGFFYSGAKTVVASQWPVSDRASVVLMDSFYKFLSKGKSKQEALTLAKREYLDNHQLSDRSPYYWASFVLIGDPNPLDRPSQAYLYWLVVIAAFAISVGLRRKLQQGKVSAQPA